MRKLLILVGILLALCACVDDEQDTNTAVVALYPETSISYVDGDTVWMKMNIISPDPIHTVDIRITGETIDSSIATYPVNNVLEYAIDSVLLVLDKDWEDSLRLALEVVVEDAANISTYPRSVLYLQKSERLPLLAEFNIYHTLNATEPDAVNLLGIEALKYENGIISLVKESSLTTDSLDHTWTSTSDVEIAKTTRSFNSITQKTIQDAFYDATVVDTVPFLEEGNSLITKFELGGLEYFTMIHMDEIVDTLEVGVDNYYKVEIKQHSK